ncbi:uncharacterized protein PSFLO_01846 [Pseudozyma flocculosa]|uniref:Uncharacterized protein n=1 Tax=Pseudozyma flocculosa TaxID=84751 RepID=A0A5C3EX67_9BASI|nr:uncharacterized protein PSFLO_01846 [Pseudozyma flocculosa]
MVVVVRSRVAGRRCWARAPSLAAAGRLRRLPSAGAACPGSSAVRHPAPPPPPPPFFALGFRPDFLAGRPRASGPNGEAGPTRHHPTSLCLPLTLACHLARPAGRPHRRTAASSSATMVHAADRERVDAETKRAKSQPAGRTVSASRSGRNSGLVVPGAGLMGVARRRGPNEVDLRSPASAVVVVGAAGDRQDQTAALASLFLVPHRSLSCTEDWNWAASTAKSTAARQTTSTTTATKCSQPDYYSTLSVLVWR